MTSDTMTLSDYVMSYVLLHHISAAAIGKSLRAITDDIWKAY